MESEHHIFRLRKTYQPIKLAKRRQNHQSVGLISRYLSSQNVSLSITNDKLLHLPVISKIQAKLSYLDSYKNFDKIIDRDSHTKSPPSPIISYLYKLQKNKLIPTTMGLLNKTASENTLDISHYSMGNSYAEAMSAGINSIKFSKAVFKNNRLTDEGASGLVEKLNFQSISEINLSQNLIGLNTIASICRVVEQAHSKLSVLILDSNNLGDRPVILLCSVLSSSERVRELSLANNNISEYGGSAIAQYLVTTQTLEKLDLHWNNIRGDGAKSLAHSLNENTSLRVLDLSWNAIISPLSDNSIASFGKAIRKNSNIFHLDISNNNFEAADTKVVIDALAANTSIIGIHMDGNGAVMDNRGFLQPIVTSSRTRNTHIYKRMLAERSRNLENCWICRCWNEVEFVIKPVEKVTSMYMHLELYNYEPELMEKSNDRSFRLSRICPPGNMKCWFSCNNTACVSSCYPQERYDVPVVVGEISSGNCNVVSIQKRTNKMWMNFHPKSCPRMKEII